MKAMRPRCKQGMSPSLSTLAPWERGGGAAREVEGEGGVPACTPGGRCLRIIIETGSVDRQRRPSVREPAVGGSSDRLLRSSSPLCAAPPRPASVSACCEPRRARQERRSRQNDADMSRNQLCSWSGCRPGTHRNTTTTSTIAGGAAACRSHDHHGHDGSRGTCQQRSCRKPGVATGGQVGSVAGWQAALWRGAMPL